MSPFHGCLLAISTLVPASVAHAATIERQEIILSSENCQPSLPAFDGNIRKRPLAMQNEGTSPAFLTCGFRGIFGVVPSQKVIGVGLINTGPAALTVTCTLVDGRNGLIDPIFITKSVEIQAGLNGALTWSGQDNSGVDFIYPAVSCSLPPNAGIRQTNRTYNEEIGT